MSEVIEKIKIEGVNFDSLEDHAVKVFNNEVTTFDQVIAVFVAACGYDRLTARHYTKKIDTDKVVVCYWNTKIQCERVVAEFKRIGVEAEVIENR